MGQLIRQDYQKYDVLVFTECGGNFGYGHVTRCISLIDELKCHFKNPLLIINNEKKDFTTSKCNYMIDGWYYDVFKYFGGAELNKPISIIDSYVADIKVYENIAELSSIVLYIDDTYRLSYPAGVIVNPSLNANCLSYEQNAGLKYLLGKDYVILRKAFIEASKSFNRAAKDQIEDILITMGGSDIRNLTPKIITALNSNRYSNVTKHVVIGKGFNNEEKIKEVKTSSTKLYYDLSAKSLCNLMRTCDYAITAAGQTVYELIAMNLPFLCIKVIDNQDNNLTGLRNEKVISEFLDYSDGNTNQDFENDLIRMLNNYTSLDMRARQIAAMKQLDLRHGANRIIKELLNNI